jgi:hypothetical protein
VKIQVGFQIDEEARKCDANLCLQLYLEFY